MTGAEREHAGMMTGTIGYKVVIRRAGYLVDTGDWLIVNDTRFDVTSVKDLHGEGEYLELECRTDQTAIGEHTTR